MANGNGQPTQTRQQGPTAAPPRAAAPLQKPEAGKTGNTGVDLRAFLEANKGRIAEVASKHLSADRIVRLASLAIHKDKSGQLARATPISILQSVMEASRLGLEIGGALGHAYIVAYKNNVAPKGKAPIWAVEAQLQVGYRGLIELALRSGKVASVTSSVVWDSDAFDYEEGDNARVFHKPNLEDARVKWRFVYCIIKLRGDPLHDKEGRVIGEIGGETIREVMSHAQVMKVKARSKSASSGGGPWGTDEPEMARKTVVRRGLKYAPMSTELADALDKDDEDFVDTEVLARTEIPKGQEGLKALVAKSVGTEAPAQETPGDDVPPPSDDDVPHDAVTGEVKDPAPAPQSEDPEDPPASTDDEQDAFDAAFAKKP
jgi:recombination protein RecT